MSSTLRITYDPNSQFCALKHGYNRRFFDFLKLGVKPLSYRRWNSVTNTWEVHISKLPLVVAFGRRHFAHVDYSDLPASLQIELVAKLGNYRDEITPKPVPSTPFEVLHLLPSAPLEVVKAAYKALAFIHHPDRGGDSETFKAISQAFEQIVGREE